MGQYFYVVNLDKQEYLHPHDLDDCLKLGEFCHTLDVLSYLLADSYGYVKSAEIGRWRGDRIVVAGDYSQWKASIDEEGEDVNAYYLAQGHFTRISKLSSIQELSRLLK